MCLRSPSLQTRAASYVLRFGIWYSPGQKQAFPCKPCCDPALGTKYSRHPRAPLPAVIVRAVAAGAASSQMSKLSTEPSSLTPKAALSVKGDIAPSVSLTFAKKLQDTTFSFTVTDQTLRQPSEFTGYVVSATRTDGATPARLGSPSTLHPALCRMCLSNWNHRAARSVVTRCSGATDQTPGGRLLPLPAAACSMQTLHSDANSWTVSTESR